MQLQAKAGSMLKNCSYLPCTLCSFLFISPFSCAEPIKDGSLACKQHPQRPAGGAHPSRARIACQPQHGLVHRDEPQKREKKPGNTNRSFHASHGSKTTFVAKCAPDRKIQPILTPGRA
uniref:Uncharacterized protein n=1 Tax=Sphaerodactylus townsendi TaxID=933632 RepID=A0ACB8FX90_9SAUR